MARELQVLAEAFYLARFAPEWAARPYWLLRRCVVPYVAIDQFLILRRDNIPVAFVGWAYTRPGEECPWQRPQYLPSAADLTGSGNCCVTELISPFLPRGRVLAEVARHLGLFLPPDWAEYDANRRLVAIHPGIASPERNPDGLS